MVGTTARRLSFRKVMRRMLVPAGQLPTSNDADQDNMLGIYTLSDSACLISLKRQRQEVLMEHLEIWEVTCIGYLAG